MLKRQCSQAYITGCNDRDYKDMVSHVKAIIFLSTPHRGCNNAKYLSSLLGVFNLSKQYITELSASGALLQDINHNFSNMCSDLKLFSFYETGKTSFSGIGIYVCDVVLLHQSTQLTGSEVVDKDSGVMNLPNEASASMCVNHHAICKFKSREDQGFKYIKNTLLHLVDPFLEASKLP